MNQQSYPIEVQADFLEKQSKAKPVAAVAELIWNGLDADATQVNVRLEYSELGGMNKVVITDNGTGIPFEEAPQLFTRLGGSWKKQESYTKSKKRMLHGCEGRGRFKALAIGRVAIWKVRYRSADGVVRRYDITMIEDNLREVRISPESDIPGGTPGVEVELSELNHEFTSLEPENAVQELCETFALYLKNYRDASIFYEGIHINPSSAIESTHNTPLRSIGIKDEKYPVELEIIQWRRITSRSLYLCTEKGFPLSKVPTRFHVGGFLFSAYLKSPYFTELHQQDRLDLAEMDPLLSKCIDQAYQAIKDYFRERQAARARAVVEDWKAEEIYPYQGEPMSPLEEAERQVFEIVAVTASDYLPDFQSGPPKKRAFDLRMLRTAIEKSPEELQIIMNEVLGLPKRKQEELATLLQEASLSSIISAAKTVGDRLKFLSALEMILFDKEMKNRLKERSQLHKMLEESTWMFGEEYNLSVSDKSLTAVLEKHRQLLCDDIVIDEPVKHISQERGIIDLMMSRALRRHRSNELEHLIVELKRPNVKIGDEEVTQIEKYAISVAKDERFRTVGGVKWTFWVISDDIDQYADYRMDKDGVINRKNNMTVGIKTWGQIIDENKARLQFFQEKLEHQVDDETALKYLQEKYKKFLAGVIVAEDNDSTKESED